MPPACTMCALWQGSPWLHLAVRCTSPVLYLWWHPIWVVIRLALNISKQKGNSRSLLILASKPHSQSNPRQWQANPLSLVASVVVGPAAAAPPVSAVGAMATPITSHNLAPAEMPAISYMAAISTPLPSKEKKSPNGHKSRDRYPSQTQPKHIMQENPPSQPKSLSLSLPHRVNTFLPAAYTLPVAHQACPQVAGTSSQPPADCLGQKPTLLS